jgi:hypothetical protein
MIVKKGQNLKRLHMYMLTQGPFRKWNTIIALIVRFKTTLAKEEVISLSLF